MILSETQDKNARLNSTVTMLRQNLDECRTERKWQECVLQVTRMSSSLINVFKNNLISDAHFPLPVVFVSVKHS